MRRSGLAQPPDDAQGLPFAGPHDGGRCATGLVATARLGLVEGRIRAGKEVGGIGDTGCQPDADRDGTRTDSDGCDGQRPNLGMHFPRDAQGAGLVRVGQQENELLAADPADEIRGAVHACGQAPGEPLQHLVADRVAIAVVVALEVVRIDDEQRERPARAACIGAGSPVRFLEAPAVGQPGQGVGL